MGPAHPRWRGASGSRVPNTVDLASPRSRRSNTTRPPPSPPDRTPSWIQQTPSAIPNIPRQTHRPSEPTNPQLTPPTSPSTHPTNPTPFTQGSASSAGARNAFCVAAGFVLATAAPSPSCARDSAQSRTHRSRPRTHAGDAARFSRVSRGRSPAHRSPACGQRRAPPGLRPCGARRRWRTGTRARPGRDRPGPGRREPCRSALAVPAQSNSPRSEVNS